MRIRVKHCEAVNAGSSGGLKGCSNTDLNLWNEHFRSSGWSTLRARLLSIRALDVGNIDDLPQCKKEMVF